MRCGIGRKTPTSSAKRRGFPRPRRNRWPTSCAWLPPLKTPIRTRPDMSGTATVYQLRIALPYIKPAIWRRLEVPGTMTFGGLHDAIQTAMGWENCHLWAFYVGKTEVSPESEQFDFPGEPPARPADSTTLDKMLGARPIKFRYVYDMGDDWLHEIKVEKAFAAAAGVQYPRCTGGGRACPPQGWAGFSRYFS